MSSRLLVVTPCFHGYGKSIGEALRRRGHDVVVHEYDAAPRAEKLWNKVRYELPAKVRGTRGHLSAELVTARAVQKLKEVRPDLVLTVRGDVLQANYWQAVADNSGQAVVWLYDELRRMALDVDVVSQVATVATYSRGDTNTLVERGVDAHHVPLAHDRSLRPERTAPRGVISFVGARFPARQEALDTLLAHGIPTLAHGRDWSGHPVDRLRTWRLSTPGVPAGRDVSLAQAYGIMAGSAATLNIHGDQDGFTMRTFESCGIGAVQIVDRDDVDEFYEPGTEVLVQHSPAELVEIARRVLADRTRMAAMREAARRRTMAEHTLDHRVAVLDTLW